MRILISILLLLVLLPGYDGVGRLALFAPHPVMSATPVALDPEHPANRRAGQLTFLGGVWLRSADPAFGGFSSLSVHGVQFTLLSDGGNIVRFRMGPDLVPQDAHFAELPAGPGTGWEKRDRDSESMVRDPVSGRIWVGFERANAIWRYDGAFTRAEARVRPPAMVRWPVNGGPESLVRLRDGGFIVIGETARAPHRPGREAVYFNGDPTHAPRTGFRFSYFPPAGYDPSDATELPDGRLLVLNRRFALPFRFSAKLTIVDRAAIRPGGVATGREIATLAAPLIHDNFEGVAVTREAGATIVWLVSDDNQMLLQRSLLLKFRLDERGAPSAAPRQEIRRRSASSARRASGGAP